MLLCRPAPRRFHCVGHHLVLLLLQVLLLQLLLQLLLLLLLQLLLLRLLPLQIAKQIPSNHRLMMTGSPIQNNLKELWCIFDFVSPDRLGGSHSAPAAVSLQASWVG